MYDSCRIDYFIVSLLRKSTKFCFLPTHCALLKPNINLTRSCCNENLPQYTAIAQVQKCTSITLPKNYIPLAKEAIFIPYFCDSHKSITLDTFSELGLDTRLVDALSELGIVTPTEIQQKSIPTLINSMHDFIGLAQTGTGKTAAFGLPLLHTIDENLYATQGVILAPTRELAQQITESIKTFAKNIRKIKVECVYGGAAIINQIKALKAKPQIIVATPGRLVDLIQRQVVKFDALKYVVLDEADEMLNMGFKEELNKILDVTPNNKTTWLFSATMPNAIRNIVNNYMNKPTEISVKSGVEVNKNITHQYMVVKMSDKQETIRRIIDMNPNFYGVIFCKTKIDTQQLAEEIGKLGYRIEALHGDLTQKQRDMVMRKFKNKAIRLLVATDVAARGIDVHNLTHVLHHRLPDEIEYYTHRSGRTARAGKKGVSIALATKGDIRKINQIERQLKIQFEQTLIPTAHDVQQTRLINWTNNIISQESIKDIPKEILAEVHQLISGISTNELVDKLLAIEWSKIDSSNLRNLNASHHPSKSKEERNTRSRSEYSLRNDNKPKGKGNTHRFFINLGKIDDISHTEMLQMICDIAQINKSAIGKIDIQQKHAYFEVEKTASANVTAKFRGYELDGREIRVNRDDTEPPRKGGKVRRPRIPNTSRGSRGRRY